MNEWAIFLNQYLYLHVVVTSLVIHEKWAKLAHTNFGPFLAAGCGYHPTRSSGGACRVTKCTSQPFIQLGQFFQQKIRLCDKTWPNSDSCLEIRQQQMAIFFSVNSAQ